MGKYILFVAVLVLNGCVVPSSVSDLTGYPRGSEIELTSNAILYECDSFTSNYEVWFGRSGTTRCLKAALENHYSDEVITVYPKGTTIQIGRAYWVNGIDTENYFIKAIVKFNGSEEECIINAYNIDQLFKPNR